MPIRRLTGAQQAFPSRRSDRAPRVRAYAHWNMFELFRLRSELGSQLKYVGRSDAGADVEVYGGSWTAEGCGGRNGI